jgi:hypothetical protein
MTTMDNRCASWLRQSLRWQRTGDAAFPYDIRTDVTTLILRLNDFPVEQQYTLIVNGEELCSFDDWPEAWDRAD